MKRIAILQRSDNRIDPKAVYPLFDTLSSLGCEICLPKSVYSVYSGHTGTMCGVGDDLFYKSEFGHLKFGEISELAEIDSDDRNFQGCVFSCGGND